MTVTVTVYVLAMFSLSNEIPGRACRRQTTGPPRNRKLGRERADKNFFPSCFSQHLHTSYTSGTNQLHIRYMHTMFTRCTAVLQTIWASTPELLGNCTHLVLGRSLLFLSQEQLHQPSWTPLEEAFRPEWRGQSPQPQQEQYPASSFLTTTYIDKVQQAASSSRPGSRAASRSASRAGTPRHAGGTTPGVGGTNGNRVVDDLLKTGGGLLTPGGGLLTTGGVRGGVAGGAGVGESGSQSGGTRGAKVYEVTVELPGDL